MGAIFTLFFLLFQLVSHPCKAAVWEYKREFIITVVPR